MRVSGTLLTTLLAMTSMAAFTTSPEPKPKRREETEKYEAYRNTIFETDKKLQEMAAYQERLLMERNERQIKEYIKIGQAKVDKAQEKRDRRAAKNQQKT